MSCPTKAEGFPESQKQNDNPTQYLIATPFVISSNPSAAVLLSLTHTSIIVNGDFPTILIPRKIIPLDSKITYRINIPHTHQTQKQTWFLQIISNNFRLRLSTLENDHFATWEDVLRRRIAKHGFWEDYKPVRKISKGLTSSVYEVTRVKDGRKFAVKAFSKKTLEQNPAVAKGLQLEINLLRQIRELQHNNLLGLEEVYLSESSIYLVMQLCGRDLIHGFNHINLCHELKVRQIMKQLISGLQALHEKGVIHRDIKPSNIMFKIGEKLELVIMDFGLSVQVGADHPFVRCGTPGFIAPQVFALKDKEKLTNHACDMFSIGSVFHLLLTGELLFSAASSAQVFTKNRKMDFDLSHERYHRINPCSMNLLKMMLIADPQQRITAKEALKHEFFLDLQSKLRSPAPTFLSANHLQFANEQEFSEIDLGITGRKRIKGEYRKASEL